MEGLHNFYIISIDEEFNVATKNMLNLVNEKEEEKTAENSSLRATGGSISPPRQAVFDLDSKRSSGEKVDVKVEMIRCKTSHKCVNEHDKASNWIPGLQTRISRTLCCPEN